MNAWLRPRDLAADLQQAGPTGPSAWWNAWRRTCRSWRRMRGMRLRDGAP